MQNYGNNKCDYGCNNEECNWDGLDCESEPAQLADGTLFIHLLVEEQEFLNNTVAFLRKIGHTLRTNVRFKMNRTSGYPMISRYNEAELPYEIHPKMG